MNFTIAVAKEDFDNLLTNTTDEFNSKSVLKCRRLGGKIKKKNKFDLIKLSQDGLQIATKKVHKLLTKPINSIFTKRNSFIIIFVVVFLLLLDSFFYLKKVNSFYYCT